MDPERKISPPKENLFLKNMCNGSISLVSRSAASKQNQQISFDVNSSEAFHVEPMLVNIDPDRNKNKLFGKACNMSISPNKLFKTTTVKKFDVAKAFRHFNTKMMSKNKRPVGCAIMTEPTVKFPAAPNPAISINEIERCLHESAQKFKNETNKENNSRYGAVSSCSPCRKCFGAERKSYDLGNVLLADVPPTLLDDILDMDKEYKAKQQQVLPDDLNGVTVDPNIFTDFEGLNINDIIDLFGVTEPSKQIV